MNLAQTTDLIYKDWVTFAATGPKPFCLGNEEGEGLDQGSAPWYRVSVREAAGGRANLNGVPTTRRYERKGFLAIQCFAPVNGGDKAGMTMAEEARAYFEDRRLSNEVIYINANIRPQPPDGKWNPVLLEVAIEFTEFK